MSANQKFTLSRTFEASQEEVFNAFSDAASLAQWWGPVEAPIDVISLDFRPGGRFHYRMNGKMVYYGLFQYKQIQPYDLLVWINSFATESGEITKAPFPGLDFPLEVLNTITLEAHEGKTKLTLVSEPVNATASEQAAFDMIQDGMQQGFNGTLNQLEAFLKKSRT